MTNKEQLVKDLTAKDEQKALHAAKEIIDNADVEAFKLLAQKSDFLFDFVKNNVNKRLQKAINKDNYRNLFKFLDVYSPDFEDTIVGSFAGFANEDLTDEIMELFEKGTDNEKAYCAKYFSYIPDTIAADILIQYAFSDNEAISFNSAKALGAMKIQEAYDKAIELLNSDDDFTVLKAVKFLIAYEDKNAVKDLLQAMEKSSMSENIAGEIPYLQSLMELLQEDITSALTCLDNILSGLGEILPLNQIFCFEMFDVLSYLITYNGQNKNPQAAVVLLKALSKFEMLNENDEYTFDEDKNTKQEISEIYTILKRQQEYFWNAQKKLAILEISESSATAGRISSALRVACEYNLTTAEENIKSLLNSQNEILLCEAVSALKQINKLDGINKEEVLAKVHDENKKAIINSLF
ncbi:MAG: HEAT repeat domain-containing protein [Clostridium sp.]|nr:HEAT repeat domain-containing protein [Clostridium sp.]